MDRDVLQVFTAAFIAELDMEKSRKSDLLEYVSVAGKDELLYYLATGSIATGIIQEAQMLTYTESIVENLVNEVSWQGAKDVAKKAGSAVKAAPGKVAQTAKNVAFDAQVKARGLKKSIPHNLAGMKKGAGEKLAAGKEAVKKFAGTKTGKGVGIALAVAAATAASYVAYKKFFSAGAKACKAAPDKKACLQQYKKKAAMAKAAALQAGMSKCASSSNPEKCKSSLASKVAKAKAEAAAIG
jgi:hypothetical protein